MKKLSIIIPIYNVERYLYRCLDNLCSQLTQDVEVILINDGSQDSCDSICKSFINSYPTIKYIMQDNSGVSVARNNGIEIATGEYITFIDPDDTVSDTYIVDILKELSVGSDLLILRYKKIYDDKTEDGPYNIWEDGECDFSGLKRSISYLFLNEVWNKVFKREIIEKNKVRFNPSMKIAEDACFVMDYVDSIANARVAKGCYYYYWINEGSAVRCVKQEHIVDLMLLYIRLIKFAQENSLQDGSGNQPSDFVIHNIAELFKDSKYEKKKLSNTIQRCGIIGILEECVHSGLRNKLVFRWVKCIVFEQEKRAFLYRLVLSIYDRIKVIKK